VLGRMLPGVAAMSQRGEHGSPSGPADPIERVGYCHPPQEHRFKKGASGNPNGRPRKKPADPGGPSSEWSNLVKKVGNRSLRVTENGHSQTMTSLEAILRVVEGKALKGDMNAARLMLEHFSKAEQAERKDHQRRFEQQVDYKRRWAQEAHRSELEGYEPFIPVPNPEDIAIDSRKGEAIFNGPIDDVDKAYWDRSKSERIDAAQNLKDLKEKLGGSDKELKSFGATREDLESMLAERIEKLETLDAFYPAVEVRRRPGFNLEQWRKEKGKGRKRPRWD
jgi:hypothetical protein